MIPKNLYPI